MTRKLLLALVVVMVGIVGVVGAQQDDPERETPLICDKFTDSPDNERVTYYMGEGVAYYVSGQLSRANDSFSCIIEQIDGSYVPAYTHRAVIYTEQRDYDEAIEDYGSAIGLDGDLIGAYNNRGIAFAAQREYDDAIADFNRALEIDSTYQLSLVNRGVIYAVTGEFESSIADLELAMSQSGIDAVVADLTRPDRRGDDPDPVYEVEDAHVYAILGIVYSGFALDNYENYLLLTGSQGDRRVQSAAGSLESRFNFDLRLDDGTWLLATEFIPGG